jgi:hypothetical protein
VRIRLLFGVACTAAVVAAQIATPAAGGKAYFCGVVEQTTLLWPHGHKTLRSFHVPAATTPNIQVYRYDPNFAGGNLVVYADARGRTKIVKTYCGAAPSVAASPIADPQTLTGKRAVSCSNRATQAFEVTHTGSSVTVRGRVASTTLWIATMTRRGKAKITYDGSACQIGPSP